MAQGDICTQHSGIVVKLDNQDHRIETIEKCTEDLKKKVDSMKNWLIATLTTMIITLLGVLINILISLQN